ncbi:kinase-like protein [Ceratobasidium sp. AG-I]|nr:kinase-like protein [Ceratobasidium sp. AG-I]
MFLQPFLSNITTMLTRFVGQKNGASQGPVGTVINSLMSLSDVISVLTAHGCENITNRLKLSSCSDLPLSCGGFGDVYRGKLNDGTPVAIKTMRIQILSTNEIQKPLKNAARELHTWSKCQHPNVLRLLGLVQFRNQIGMVAEWMDNGSLIAYILQQAAANRYQLCVQVCDGLSYLHGIGVIHGDLKGLNVLVSSDGTAMLGDFGNAVLQGRTLLFTATTVKNALSPRWAAPELIDGSGIYSIAADVYALGMETITGQMPYAGKTDHAVYFAVAVTKEPPTRPEEYIPSNSPHGEELWSLLLRCWTYESKDRPSAANVGAIMRTITPNGTSRKRITPKANKGTTNVRAPQRGKSAAKADGAPLKPDKAVPPVGTIRPTSKHNAAPMPFLLPGRPSSPPFWVEKPAASTRPRLKSEPLPVRPRRMGMMGPSTENMRPRRVTHV